MIGKGPYPPPTRPTPRLAKRGTRPGISPGVRLLVSKTETPGLGRTCRIGATAFSGRGWPFVDSVWRQTEIFGRRSSRSSFRRSSRSSFRRHPLYPRQGRRRRTNWRTPERRRFFRHRFRRGINLFRLYCWRRRKAGYHHQPYLPPPNPATLHQSAILHAAALFYV